MLKTLKFVRGAVATKDYVPVLTHFCIRQGRILGYNGRIALNSPIALDLEANPRAEQFVRAIATCEQEVALSVTPAGRLAIASGGFKAFIDCTTEPYPDVRPSGQHVYPTGHFVAALRRLLPFVAEDASRPWAMGILLHEYSAYATNNILIAEGWLGFKFPVTINLPKTTAEELLRIGEEPIGMQVDAASITFYYEGDRWLHSVLYTTAWPDVTKILARFDTTRRWEKVPVELFKSLKDLRPFVDDAGRIHVSPAGSATSTDTGSGASVMLPLWDKSMCFNVDQLMLLDGVAQWLNPDEHPYLWIGEGIRGAIAAMR